jgi:hypothetical protein
MDRRITTIAARRETVLPHLFLSRMIATRFLFRHLILIPGGVA